VVGSICSIACSTSSRTSAHAQPDAVSVACHDGLEDPAVILQRAGDRAGQAVGMLTHAGQHVGDGIVQQHQNRIVGRANDRSVEGQISNDVLTGAGVIGHSFQGFSHGGQICRSGAPGRQRGGRHFQHAPRLQHVMQVALPLPQLKLQQAGNRLRVLLCDARAASMLHRHEATGRQHPQCLADGSPTHAEALDQFLFGW